MRKRIIKQHPQNTFSGESKTLDLNKLAQVEVTSEEAAYPIEEALTKSGKPGWRASEAGEQRIRLIFDEPQRISSIHLLFEESQQARTQEFVLQWLPAGGQAYREIVRQQFNFSPGFSGKEQENYRVNLEDVKVLELIIVPDVSGGNDHATLVRLQIS